MRKPALIAAALVLLVVCAGGGWYWWNVWRFLQATDDAYVQSDVTLISPKIEGYIKEVRARDNEPVAVGQVLFVIDDRDFAAKAAQAEAVLATQEATVATYGTRLKLQQTMIDQASANLRSSEADLDRAQRDYKRYTALATSGRASRRRSQSTPTPTGPCMARSKVLRPAAARSSACCRPTTPPAISPRSCSACRCASRFRQTSPCCGCCVPACR